ncbi:MAG: hypothetical protein V4760_16835 [Bdellovibrionota bacterium]
MKSIITILIMLSTASVASAQTSSRNAAEVGMTSNANLTKENPTSDAYVRISSSNSLVRGDDTLGLRLGYVDYARENINDMFSLRISDRRTSSNWSFTGALFTNVYTYGSSPGTTDNAFTNVGAEFRGERSQSWRSNALEYGGGYRLRVFPSFDGRNDHTAFALATLDREMSSQLSLGAISEFGILLSSLSEYSRIYLDLGGTLDYQLPDSWTLTGDLTLSQSFFLNRTVTTQTAVSRSRGSGATGSRTSGETYSSLSLSAEGMRQQTETFRWGFGAFVTNQASASGSLDYSVLDVLAKLNLNF